MRLLTVFLFGNLLVVMLVMVQLLPTAELLLESRRLRGIPYQEALFWSLSPSSLANLFLVDKEFDPGLPQGLRLFFTDQVPFLLSHYLGAVSLFGFCFWLFCSSKGEKLFLLGLAALSVVMAFGAYTPVYPFVYRYFPILSVVRYPEKFFFITYIVLLYMVFSGLSRLCALDHRGQKTSLLLAASISLIWIGLYVVLRLRSDLLHDFIVVKNGIPPFIEIQAETTAAVLASIEKQCILSSVIFCLIYLLVKKLLRASLFGCLLIAIVFVDLAMAHRALLFPLDPKFVERGPGILRHPDRFLGRLFYYRSTQNLDPSSFMGEGQPLFQEVIALTFQDLLPNSGTVYGFDYMQEIDAISRWPYREFLAFANRLEPEKQIRLLRALNVSYLVSFRPLLIDGITLVARFPKYFSWLYKVDKTLPRAYVVNSMSVARVPRRIFERLSDPRFDPTREVILDQAIAIDSKCRLEGHAVIRHYEDRRVTVETSLNDTGILILADSFYPGWKAYVDGREEPIRRANLFFRAVLVAAGNHRVEFRYEPRSFAIGLAISIATLVALMMTVAVCYLRERKGKKSSGSSRESLIRTN